MTLTDENKNIYEVLGSGIPNYTNASLSNPIWKDGSLSANVTFSTPIPFPVSTKEITNQVVISTYSNYNNKYFADGTNVKSNRVDTNTAPLPNNIDAKNYLWAFYPEVVDNAIKFKIKNIVYFTIFLDWSQVVYISKVYSKLMYVCIYTFYPRELIAKL